MVYSITSTVAFFIPFSFFISISILFRIISRAAISHLDINGSLLVTFVVRFDTAVVKVTFSVLYLSVKSFLKWVEVVVTPAEENVLERTKVNGSRKALFCKDF